MYISLTKLKDGFWMNTVCIAMVGAVVYYSSLGDFIAIMLFGLLPVFAVNIIGYALLDLQPTVKVDKRFQVRFQTKGKDLVLNNIRRGVSIIGAAGSGKTESIVYPFLQHFSKQGFSGIIYDYKNFEITEMAYPLFKDKAIPFHIISFDKVYSRVNPIAPRYIPDVESVNEISRVLLENLLEQKETASSGSSKFFNDAVEGLLGALIWKLKVSYPKYCTLPHLITIFQYLDSKSLLAFVNSNPTTKALASAFILGADSERQTAGVLSTLANALKKISTERIFAVLSADEISLDINNPENPSVVAIVNNPKFETAYSPVIAAIVHTIVKQMSVRARKHSFLLLEEAPTIRLLNMHRIPATLRSYNIVTLYVLQDKIQNDLLYGDKASRATLSNLSYQFFGKVNDPDTAKYYERFFEIIKRPTKSISRSHTINFDTRVTEGEKEMSKIRSDVFFRLQQGEFIAFADGTEQQKRFGKPKIIKELPIASKPIDDTKIHENYIHIYRQVQQLFKSFN